VGARGGVPARPLQLLAELYRLEGENGAARQEVERALEIQPESWRGLYYAGRMAFLDGDLDGGERYLERLRRIPAVETSEPADVYLRALEGEGALARGAAAEARDIFANLVANESLMLDWASTCSSAGATIRDGLVRSELALGRSAEAMAALDGILTSGEERVDHPVIYTEALYRLGVMKLESGRSEEGRKLLKKFLSQWGSADRDLEIVADAKTRLGES
jgi:tetratricopeptide (TPR) repeat protein